MQSINPSVNSIHKASWDAAADQIEELVVSAIARKAAGLDAPSGRISSIVRQACVAHCATLTQENENLRDALRMARPMVESPYSTIPPNDWRLSIAIVLKAIDAALGGEDEKGR